jgi:hypothetical protein
MKSSRLFKELGVHLHSEVYKIKGDRSCKRSIEDQQKSYPQNKYGKSRITQQKSTYLESLNTLEREELFPRVLSFSHQLTLMIHGEGKNSRCM